MHSEERVMLFVLAICVLFVFSSQVLFAFGAPNASLVSYQQPFKIKPKYLLF